MSRLAAGLLLLCWAATAAQAAVISPRPRAVTLSIYHLGTVDTAELMQSDSDEARNQGLALVSESRALDLPAGPVEIQFRGVAATMVPQTAQVTGLPGGVRDSNFDFDLLSPGTLAAKSVGQTVHLVRTDRKTGRETRQDVILLSGPDGVMLKIGDHYEALGCSGEPERLVFDKLPDRLLDRPTLSVHALVPRAGHYNVTLRYIATGLNWSADYVAHIRADDRTLDLSGWITLANFSESGFTKVPVEVIAGHVATTGDDTPPEISTVSGQPQCWPFPQENVPMPPPPPPPALMMAPMEARPAFETVVVTGTRIEPRNLGDYKLYPLPEPTNVAARQTKQVQFLDSRGLPFRRVYRAGTGQLPEDLDDDVNLPAQIVLQLDNSKGGRLGKPLPAGGVSAMADVGGAMLLTGRDRIDDMAVGLPVEIKAGTTMAVRARARTVESTTLNEGKENEARRITVEVTAVNDKAQPAAFEWQQKMDADGRTLVSQSREHGTRNGDLVWALALKPGERVTFRYTMDVPG